MNWSINSNCESIIISSSLFKIEKDYDSLIINGKNFSGDQSISMVVPASFELQFRADNSITDDGFILEWKCHSSQLNYSDETFCGILGFVCVI